MPVAIRSPALSWATRPLSGKPRSAAGIFAYHGFWGPGVRLFRRLTFRTKALLISLLFVAPLVAVTTAYLHNARTVELRTERELAGVGFAQSALDLADSVQHQRMLAVAAAGSDSRELATAEEDVAERLRRLEDRYAVTAGYIPEEALELVRANLDKATNLAGNPVAAYKRHAQVLTALHALLDRALDGSGLGVDPEIDTRHLIQIALSDLPKATEAYLAQADLALAASAGTPATLVVGQMAEPRAIGLYLDARVRDSIDVIVAADPALSDRLSYAATSDAMTRLADAMADWATRASRSMQRRWPRSAPMSWRARACCGAPSSAFLRTASQTVPERSQGNAM